MRAVNGQLWAREVGRASQVTVPTAQHLVPPQAIKDLQTLGCKKAMMKFEGTHSW